MAAPASTPHRIRLATVDDLAAVERIVHDAYRHYVARIGATPGPMRDDYRVRIAQGQAQVLEDDTGIQAVLVLVREADCLLLDNVAVSPGAQGRGYGRALMQWAETIARQAGISAHPAVHAGSDEREHRHLSALWLCRDASRRRDRPEARVHDEKPGLTDHNK